MCNVVRASARESRRSQSVSRVKYQVRASVWSRQKNTSNFSSLTYLSLLVNLSGEHEDLNSFKFLIRPVLDNV